MDKGRTKKRFIFIILISLAITMSGVAVILMINNTPIRDSHIERYFAAKDKYLNGNLDMAIEILKTLSKQSPNLYQAKLLLAKSLFLSDQYKEADAVLRKLIRKHPAYLEAGLWLARVEMQMNNSEEASSIIRNLLSWNSDDPRLLGIMGNIEELKSNPAAAINYYRKAGLYEEELAKNRLSLARLYSRLGVYDKAKEELIQARELLESDSPLNTPLGALIDEINTILNEEE